MRNYLSMSNLRSAVLMAMVMTPLTAPRILLSGILPVQYIAASFAALTLLAGMVTAWGRSAGMREFLPSWRTSMAGCGVVMLVLGVFLPMQILIFNPTFQAALVQLDRPVIKRLLFPETVMDGMALVLWAVSFEVLFFQGAAMSFFARLTNSLPTAMICSVLLRMYVAYLKLGEIGLSSGTVFILSVVGLSSMAACLIFARFGLPATMLLAGGMALSRWTFLWE